MNGILLGPSDSSDISKIYRNAIKEADEIIIANAFLTSWGVEEKMKKGVKPLVIIGTNFGLTRKKALLALLKWMPRNEKHNLLAISPVSNVMFHPKLLAWRVGRKYRAVLGSSNLTVAAFDGNYEANASITIDRKTFESIACWAHHAAEE